MINRRTILKYLGLGSLFGYSGFNNSPKQINEWPDCSIPNLIDEIKPIINELKSKQLTNLYFSTEQYEDIRNWLINSIDEEISRCMYSGINI